MVPPTDTRHRLIYSCWPLTRTATLDSPLDYFETSGYYGGGLDASTRTYRFNLARQIQAILDDRIGNNGFYLVISGSGVQAARAILGSGKTLRTA